MDASWNIGKDSIVNIMDHLDDKDLFHFCQVHREFRTICNKEEFWKQRGTQRYPEIFTKFHTYSRRQMKYKEIYSLVSHKREMVEQILKHTNKIYEANIFPPNVAYEYREMALVLNEKFRRTLLFPLLKGISEEWSIPQDTLYMYLGSILDDSILNKYKLENKLYNELLAIAKIWYIMNREKETIRVYLYTWPVKLLKEKLKSLPLDI